MSSPPRRPSSGELPLPITVPELLNRLESTLSAGAQQPLEPRELARRLLNEREVVGASLEELTERARSAVNIDIRTRGELSRFLWRGSQLALRAWLKRPERALVEERPRLSVRVRDYPLEHQLRVLLSALDGASDNGVRRLRSAIRQPLIEGMELSVLLDPERWMSARLSGQAYSLAQALWSNSGQLLNPLRCEGALSLIEARGWAEGQEGGRWRLSPSGLRWLSEVGSSVEISSPQRAAHERSAERGVQLACDESEGLLLLLAVLIERGPAPLSELSAEWGSALRRVGRRRTLEWLEEATRTRLLHLQERALVERTGGRWGITELGLSWLRRSGLEAPTRDEGELQQLWALLHQQQQRTRESLRALLLQMDPIAFEGLICELLEKMGYHEVSLTQVSHDMGVDIIASIELGISSVREVIQVKRHQRGIHRPTLDALRGSLHRFEAVRGTLITTSHFSRGTQEAAFERGAAPITLIDGDKLIELLMEHELGVRKSTVSLWRVEPTRFELSASSVERWRATPLPEAERSVSLHQDKGTR